MDFNQFKISYERKLYEQDQYNGIKVTVSEEEIYKLYLAQIVSNDFKAKQKRFYK